MKKWFNFGYTLVFLLIFSSICLFYSDDFTRALSSRPPLFPTNQPFGIEKCQKWTEQVRDFSLFREKAAEKVTVLMYHRILEEGEIDPSIHYDKHGQLYDTIVLKSAFEEQMQFLHDHDYTTLTVKEFLLFMQGKIEVPRKSVLLTFDDGFKDNFIEAYPIMKKYQFTAANFLVTGFVSKREDKFSSSKHQYFSLSDVGKSCDVFDFQSHTYNFHQRNKQGTAYLESKAPDEIRDDLSVSLTNLSGRNRSIAYPYGAYNQNTIDVVKELGFELAFTVEYNDARPGMALYEIPRKAVYPDDTLHDFKEKINFY
ncbi:polysaccharide deacetylase family protein [Sediminibacillus dalangtanensis]|uniref:Polysaccharide deacetylase family protein n=1 Tax=Sediminibacillus dalangtanensis TaxID=2729421 RepID=A0ABX7VQQ2_9BACI|nr:polysaccharide deacetylase family protein [Sediminibacillus dalangtanensis]QTM99194.1 polysaccharide deacetylase family protein [Sediminibacillus dalangtanensis]